MTELVERVTHLEERMDDVEYLARKTSEEVAEWRGTLSRHTDVVNAASERIDNLRREVNERFDKVDQRFDKVETEMREGFTEMREGFTTLALGQAQITALLNIAIGEDEES
jgi:DNA repair ATPase RecN